MNIWLAVVIILEVLFAVFIAWGFMHEQKFVESEDRILPKIKRHAPKLQFKILMVIKRIYRNICACYLSRRGYVIKSYSPSGKNRFTVEKIGVISK